MTSLDASAPCVLKQSASCCPNGASQRRLLASRQSSGLEPDWFADGDPRRRSPIRVTLDGGADPSIQAAAPEMLQRIQSSYQDVYRCDSFSLAEDDAVLLPNTPVGLWRETEQHLVTFYGTLAEWSLDALGWLAAFLAHIAFVHGVSRPLMLTAAREGE